jgi:hypothetical protein
VYLVRPNIFTTKLAGENCTIDGVKMTAKADKQMAQVGGLAAINGFL